MRRASNVLGLALFLAAFLSLSPVLYAADNSVPDSPEIAEPLAQELASNFKASITRFKNGQDWLQMPQYREYLSANSQIASSLSALIGGYVSYGKNKSNYEQIGKNSKCPT
jgi:hypothetical protein